MEEQTSWKGHAFTLMIFGGIVVLCSIFFVLGMLVGRTQSAKLSTVASAEAATKPAIKDQVEPESFKEDLPLPEKSTRFDPAPMKPAPETPLRAKKLEAAPAPKVEDEAAAPRPVTINLQISALGKQSEAEKLVDDLKKKGFRAFMLTPAPNDPKPYYRVQVGATDRIEAESLKQKLEAAGYKNAIIKQ